MFRHDVLQGLQARHTGHLHIHGDDVGLQLLHLLDRLFSVSCDSHDLNLFVPFQHAGQALPHKGGIVHD